MFKTNSLIFLLIFLETLRGLDNIHARDFSMHFFPLLHSTFLFLCFMSQEEKSVPSINKNSWNMNSYYSTVYMELKSN